VHAQTFRFNGRFAGFSPQGHHSVPVIPGLPGARYLGPGVQETYPYTPFQQPDILRNYVQMRATSPRPDAFLGGQFNPQYRSTGYPNYGYSPTPYYGGYYGGFDPGYVTPYTSGSWSAPYSQPPVILQREIIYVQPGAQGNGAAGARTETPPPAAPQPAAGDYYLSRPTSETLKDAVADIRRAWLNGDYSRFRTRVKDEGRVRIYLKGKYQYAVPGTEFGRMTRDAMARLDTTDFDLDRVTALGENRAFAAGKHTYADAEKTRREVYVSYALARENGRWVITEAGSSTKPIEQHAE
jgi:hypothetical protein